jgi:hypothetical protein
MIRIITTYGFNGALDAIQVQCLLMGIEPAMGLTLCSLPVFLRLVRPGHDNHLPDMQLTRCSYYSSERATTASRPRAIRPGTAATSTPSDPWERSSRRREIPTGRCWIRFAIPGWASRIISHIPWLSRRKSLYILHMANIMILLILRRGTGRRPRWLMLRSKLYRLI